jgi:alkylated DNA nucleotide flippase Atl1
MIHSLDAIVGVEQLLNEFTFLGVLKMKSLSELSIEYRAVADLLGNGWSGTYGDLAVTIGRGPKSGRVIGRLVKSYARRHPEWRHESVYTKATGRPAHHN